MSRVSGLDLLRVLGIVSIVLLSGFVLTPTTHALTLIPPSVEINLTPGQTTKTVIKLYNETQNKLELYTEVRGFTAKGETGQPEYDFNGEPVGFSTWVLVEKGPIVLEPGQRVEVPVTFNTPTNADPGGHYATVFFSTAPPDQGQLRISSKLGTLLLGKVAGAVEESGTVSEFGISGGQSSFNRPPVNFFLRFNNTGNVHLKPTGTITVTSMFGKEVSKIEVNASHGATLPGTVRKYDAVWEKAAVRISNGSFISKFFTEYGNEKNNFAFGKYKATLALTVGSASRAVSAEVSFWMIPWHFLLVWVIIAALLIVLLIILLKQYNKWIIRKAQTIQQPKK